jgi:hypothetical protein
MGGPRLTLASLMGLVAVLALGLAGLSSASTFWTAAAATVTLAILLGAVLGAILLRGAEWSVCLGFALFGVVFLGLVEWGWAGGQIGHDLTAGLADLAESMIPSPVFATRASALGPPSQVPYEKLAARQIRVGNFVEISRMALALCFALFGGYLGRLFHDRQRGLPGQGPPVTS